jgi:TOMM system kinase/cyclase fusion protein
MDFYAVLDQVIDLLRRRQRVTYRALRVHFTLDEDALEALKAELIDAQRVAIDEGGKVLVWAGEPQAPRSDASPAMRPPATGERRQLTVMFCDLVDSALLASRLDPEDLREVVRTYQATCADVVQRHEGFVAQYLGDGLLIYFGYPQAHEDDASRAVRAGLGILDAMRPLNADLARTAGVKLAVRLGIHTGLVVLGAIGPGTGREQLALGEAPNLAARLQAVATPDTVVISGATYRLVHGMFSCTPLGAQSLKGVPLPVQVYGVLGESGAQGRLDVLSPAGLTPLVGREQEVGLLRERWDRVKDGRGQVVLLSGEAGIGKSRLVHVAKEHVAREPHTRLECRCSPYHQHSALFPVIDLLQRALRLRRDDTPDQKVEKLEAMLAPFGFSLPATVPLLAALLSLPVPDRYPPLSLSPQRQRQRTLETILAMLLAAAARQPTLFIVEDLQWIDPSTLDLLGLLLDQGPTARILTILTARQEFRPPWGFRAHVTAITLSRLPQSQVEVMVDRVAGGKTLPPEVLQQVVARTDGVPLFVEELTRMVLESGLLRERDDRYELTGSLPPLAIPTTLHDSLMARLDRLAALKEVAQLGAILGRSFPYELLRAISPLDEATLQHALIGLVDAELLYQRGIPPQATYLFKHALIQEAAYQSLLKSTQRQFHQRTAQALAERFPETIETQPELLAHHYTAAGLGEQAIPYWQKAGQLAVERSAYPEAITHLTKAIAVLQSLPETPERIYQELTLQLALGTPLTATRGYGAPEVERTYLRAHELCQQIGETPQLIPALLGLWRFYISRRAFGTARALGEQCLALAERVPDAAPRVRAHTTLGITLFYRGEFALARAHLGQGNALEYSRKGRSHAFVQDPVVACRTYAAQTLWCLGYPDRAFHESQQALALARELSHPFSLAFALALASTLRQIARDTDTAQASAESVIALASEQEFPVWLGVGTIVRGWALVQHGRGDEGVAQILRGFATMQAAEAEVGQSWYLTVLAEAYGQVGQTAEGLAVLARALAAAHDTEERIYEAELYRLKGDLLLRDAAPDAEQAEACFEQALDVARRQQARSWHLRAALGLSRLWLGQGKRAAARDLLAESHGWFKEGFATADAQEASALLAQMA